MQAEPLERPPIHAGRGGEPRRLGGPEAGQLRRGRSPIHFRMRVVHRGAQPERRAQPVGRLRLHALGLDGPGVLALG